jgi:hypothetical protein
MARSLEAHATDDPIIGNRSPPSHGANLTEPPRELSASFASDSSFGGRR